MPTIKRAAEEFLANKRVAVTGVSRQAKDHGSNVVYKRLRERGYEVFAVNPNADEVEGDRCYHDLTLNPRRRRGGGDRDEARDRRSRRCVSAPTSASRRCGCTARPAAGASRRRRPTSAGNGASP